MRILICSDGTDPADKPVLLGGLVAAPTKAGTTLLGIVELSGDEPPLRAALESEAAKLRRFGVSPELVVRTGEPIREILHQTTEAAYDLTIIGARRKGNTGLYWRAGKTYEVIKAIPTPVLLATGECETLKSFIVCTGGKKFIDAAIRLTGKLAAALGASVTLLHVMAEPPAIYAHLVHLEEDVESLLRSGSELGRSAFFFPFKFSISLLCPRISASPIKTASTPHALIRSKSSAVRIPLSLTSTISSGTSSLNFSVTLRSTSKVPRSRLLMPMIRALVSKARSSSTSVCTSTSASS